ncbi:MAG: hypothetical protein IJF49_02645 [Clostridia bacterium]|nr:hypothetical protein [Clostridia bacterium]
MSPIRKIALRRIKQAPIKHLLLFAAILVSMMLISMLVFFSAETILRQNLAEKELPLSSFLQTVRLCITVAAGFLVLCSAIMIRIHIGLNRKQNEQLLAVLTSVGASPAQKKAFPFTQLQLIYAPAALCGILPGSLLGVTLGRRFLGTLGALISPAPSALLYLGVLLAQVIVGVGITALCCLLPQITFTPRSVISALKRQNPRAAVTSHSYRQSNTFKQKSLLRRLAQKSVDYSAPTYHTISLSFSISAFYPILMLLMMWHLLHVKVVLDANPFDGIETTGAVVSAVSHLFLCLGIFFLLLTLIGLASAWLMVRLQYANRRAAGKTYFSIGMDNADFRRVMRHELQTLILRSAIVLLIGTMIANTAFLMCVGG